MEQTPNYPVCWPGGLGFEGQIKTFWVDDFNQELTDSRWKRQPGLLLTDAPGKTKSLCIARTHSPEASAIQTHTLTKTEYFWYVSCLPLFLTVSCMYWSRSHESCHVARGEKNTGKRVCVWSQAVLSFIKLKQCRISTESQWCNSECKMWYFGAIYIIIFGLCFSAQIRKSAGGGFTKLDFSLPSVPV